MVPLVRWKFTPLTPIANILPNAGIVCSYESLQLVLHVFLFSLFSVLTLHIVSFAFKSKVKKIYANLSFAYLISLLRQLVIKGKVCKDERWLASHLGLILKFMLGPIKKKHGS